MAYIQTVWLFELCDAAMVQYQIKFARDTVQR